MDPEPQIKPIGHDGEIDIAVTCDLWSAALPRLKALTHSAASAAAVHVPEARSGELSIVFVDDAEIHALNKAYRGKDKSTNVLSFPADNINPCLGDIVIAYETCVREAGEKAISLANHTTHLLVHGYLHLTGYDHIQETEAEQMEAMEVKILRSLGIANPYEKPTHV